MKNTEIKIYHDFLLRRVLIIIFCNDRKEVLNLYTSEIKILKDDEQIPDDFIMKIPAVMEPQFLKAFAEALDEKGVKTENDFKIQGLLKATKYHLEDMRKIVFKKES